jgi:Tol biopolymer transport system component
MRPSKTDGNILREGRREGRLTRKPLGRVSTVNIIKFGIAMEIKTTKSQFNPFWRVCILAVMGMSGCAPAMQDRLVFDSRPADDDEIPSVNPVGTGLKNLTHHPANDANPAWSRNGRKIAVQSDRNGKSAVHIMDADGTKIQAVPGAGPLGSPAGLSPDGQDLLLASYRDVKGEVCAVRPDGSQLTDLTRNPAEDAAPAWSPDGKGIAFSSNREAIHGKPVYQIYVLDPAGGAVQRLTQSAYGAYDPVWSPDGKQIAFGMSPPNPPRDLMLVAFAKSPTVFGEVETAYVMQADGSHPGPLTDNITGWSIPQAWSPDGKQVVIHCDSSLQGENPETRITSLNGGVSFALPDEAAAGGNRRGWSATQPLEAVALPPPSAPQTEAPALPLALINGTLMDGTDGAPVRDAVIEMENGRMTAVGKRDQVSIPAGRKSWTCRGRHAAGFFNAHVHSSFTAATFSGWIQGGVTRVCDLGARRSYPTLFAFRDTVMTHLQYSRRMAAGPILTAPNGYPNSYFEYLRVAGYNGVTSADDARRKATQRLEGGADIGKIASESGVLLHQNPPMLSPEETAAIVEVHTRAAPESWPMFRSPPIWKKLWMRRWTTSRT